MVDGQHGWVRRALHEPLLHFALLGGAVFGLFHLRGIGTDEHTIRVDAVKQRELSALFAERHGRAPSHQERAELAERYVEDEVLVREAASLSLVAQQGPVRDATLAQMRSLLQGASEVQDPDEQALRRFHEQHRADYRLPERVTAYEYLIPSGSDAEDDARRLVRALTDGQVVDRLRSDYLRTSEADLSQLHGPAWARRVFELPSGTWSTLRSPRGLHVVSVEQHVAAEDPPFEQLRPQLRADYQISTTEQRFAAELARLRAAYEVRMESTVP